MTSNALDVMAEPIDVNPIFNFGTFFQHPKSSFFFFPKHFEFTKFAMV